MTAHRPKSRGFAMIATLTLMAMVAMLLGLMSMWVTQHVRADLLASRQAQLRQAMLAGSLSWLSESRGKDLPANATWEVAVSGELSAAGFRVTVSLLPNEPGRPRRAKIEARVEQLAMDQIVEAPR